MKIRKSQEGVDLPDEMRVEERLRHSLIAHQLPDRVRAKVWLEISRRHQLSERRRRLRLISAGSVAAAILLALLFWHSPEPTAPILVQQQPQLHLEPVEEPAAAPPQLIEVEPVSLPIY